MAFAPPLHLGRDPTRQHGRALRGRAVCGTRRGARSDAARRRSAPVVATGGMPSASASASTSTATGPFCVKCGSRTEVRVPADDNRPRAVCVADGCGAVQYENPKVVVGAVATTPDGARVLLTRRAIAPRIGSWTIPAGFLENGETAEEGARRETFEEAGIDALFRPVTLLGVYNILPANQVQLVYRATVPPAAVPAPGPEASEARLFEWDRIPWHELAFPTVEWALKFARAHVGVEVRQPDIRTR